MDWIERILHLSPDGGTGATEIAVVVAAALGLGLGFVFRRRPSPRRLPSRDEDPTKGWSR